jgi:hypothetical protein
VYVLWTELAARDGEESQSQTGDEVEPQLIATNAQFSTDSQAARIKFYVFWPYGRNSDVGLIKEVTTSI